MDDKSGFGEQALNKAVEIGLTNQLDEVENLDVNIKTDPLKLIQGQVDSVHIQAEGMVMQKDLEVQEMDLKLTNVDINPIKMAFGEIELNKPSNAMTRVVLTESGIERAFNSQYVREQLQKQQIHIGGQATAIDAQNVKFSLPGDGKVALSASVVLQSTGETRQVVFSATPSVSANGQTISLENVEYGAEGELSPELTQALVAETSEILNLSNFDLDGIEFKIKELNLEVGKMTLIAEAYIEKIPTS